MVYNGRFEINEPRPLSPKSEIGETVEVDSLSVSHSVTFFTN